MAFREEYKRFQGHRLQCDREANANFPMALQKTQRSVEKDKFSEFDFSLLRMHEASLAGRPVINSNSFRVNETSRFIVETGMHYSFGPVVVTL